MSSMRFVLCACGAHGTFRDLLGNEGPDVASKEEAISVLDTALMNGLISTAETLEFLQKIQSSGMAEFEKDVPRDLWRKVRDWERMRASTNGRLPFESFHETLDDPGPF